MEEDELVLPVLLQAARGTYVRAIRERLAAAGCDDLPPMGSRVLGALARGRVTDVARLVGRSKQAASQLVDAMVMRGYLVREPDPADRRRVVLQLTERGALAAREVRAAVDDVDESLLSALGDEGVRALRRGLEALAS